MLCPCDSCGFSVPVVFRSEAQCDGNGYSLVEHWNEAAGDHRGALRLSLSTPTDCVAPLDKGIAIASETRLAVNLDKLTETVTITWAEHRCEFSW